MRLGVFGEVRMSPELAGVTAALEKICTEIVGPDATAVDRDGAFPERGVKARNFM
jgi:hypothetical protein